MRCTLRAPAPSADSLQHLFGHREVGNDAVLQRPDCRDVPRRAAQHVLGFQADGFDNPAAPTAVLAYGYYGWLVEDDSVAAGIDKGIGRPEIDRQIVREVPEDVFEHAALGSKRRGNNRRNLTMPTTLSKAVCIIVDA